MYTIVQQLRRRFGRCETRKQMQVGDFVGITESNMPNHHITYGRVNRFYDLIDGGEGVEIGNTSLPIKMITSVTFFKSKDQMIESGKLHYAKLPG